MATGFMQRFKGKIAAAQINLSGLLYESFTDAITTGVVQTQAGATQLSAEINRVTINSVSGNGARLPAAAPGLTIMVINRTPLPMQVYGASTDLINDVAAATGVSQMQNSVVIYTCASPSLWYAEGIGGGFAGSFQTFSAKDALVGAGANQAGATPIPAMMDRFTTVAVGTGAVLPIAVAGMNITVINAGANPLQIYGNGSDTINGTAGPTGVALAVGKTAEYFTTVAGAWHQLLSA